MTSDNGDKASDRYCTLPWVLDLVDEFWLFGIDCDPFHDPQSSVRAKNTIDIRTGGDAYTDFWPGVTAWVNGGYSGKLPAKTAEWCAKQHAKGHEILNLCPAAPGSEYWRSWVWPNARAIAWLGRLSFRAAVDVHTKSGQLVCKAGEVKNGNRTEIALVYYGDDELRFEHIFGRRFWVSLV